LEKEQKMVDSVSFGPARPVPGLRLQAVKPDAKQQELNVGSAGPQSLSLAAALTQLGPPYDADKVATLRAAIASGDYRIQLGNIANGIIRFGGSELG
jgi:anti-sigma28 factor (negative regulator of flagellin synthesis)